MRGRPKHVVPYRGKWAVREQGKSEVLSTHLTQREAEQHAKELARRDRTEVFIHGRNGQFQDRDGYGPDPCPPRDKRH